MCVCVPSCSFPVVFALPVRQTARELLHVAEDRWERRAEATQRRLGDNITAVILRIFEVDGR